MFKSKTETSLIRDRKDAGVRLASALAPLLSQVESRDLVVLGLARGGIPVAFEIARRFGGTLDAWSIRKIGAPGQPELAIGAVGPGQVRILDTSLIRDLELSPATIQRLSARAADERDRIDNVLRDGRALTPLEEKVVVLADDGLATGASMRAALAAVSAHLPQRMIVAVPVAPPEVLNELRRGGVETVAIFQPVNFRAVSQWYQDFAPVTVATVRSMLTTGPHPIPPTDPR